MNCFYGLIRLYIKTKREKKCFLFTNINNNYVLLFCKMYKHTIVFVHSQMAENQFVIKNH